MLDTLFNPGGRIGPVAFRNAALTLIALGAAISLTPLVLPALWMLSFTGFVMIYPWAVIYRQPGFEWLGLAEMGVFLGILMVGYVYAWDSGALKWQ